MTNLNKPWEAATAESIGLDAAAMTMKEFSTLHERYGAEFAKYTGAAREEVKMFFICKYAKYLYDAKRYTAADTSGCQTLAEVKAIYNYLPSDKRSRVAEQSFDLAPSTMEIVRYLQMLQCINNRKNAPIPAKEVAAAYAAKDAAKGTK